MTLQAQEEEAVRKALLKAGGHTELDTRGVNAYQRRGRTDEAVPFTGRGPRVIADLPCRSRR